MLAQHGAFAEGLKRNHLTEERNGGFGAPGGRSVIHPTWEEHCTGGENYGASEGPDGLDGPEEGRLGPENGELGPENKEDEALAKAEEFQLPEQSVSATARQSYFKEKKRPRSHGKKYRKKAVSMDGSELDGSLGDNSSAWGKLELKGAKAGTARADEDEYRFWVPGTKYIVEPRCKAALVWMVFILIVTVWASICTPLEIAWYSSDTSWAATGFFLVTNSIIIIVFACDIFVNFNLAYVDPENGYLVSSRRKIARNYMKFWFWIDFLATVPIDAIVLAAEGSGGSSAQVLRLFKLMRLFRIAKVMTSKRVLRLIEAEHAINYDAVSLIGFFFSLLLLMHLMACGLFMVALQGGQTEEESIFYKDNAAEDEYALADYNVFNQWLFGMYWSAMTVSTIGYGDVTLHTNALRGYAIICMLVGASAYAYMVGALINVVLNMNKHEQERRNILSEVNDMVRSVGLEPKYRRRIRMFFSKTDSGDGGLREYRPYLSRLSPPLAAQVIRTMMKDWIKDMWWLERGLLDNNLVIGFAQLITEQSFAPREALFNRNDAANAMYICTGNVVVVGKGRIFARGKGVGEEILLPKRGSYGYSVFAGSYVDAFRFDRSSFREFLHSYPVLHPRVRWTVLAIYVNRRGGVRYLDETSTMEGKSRYELNRSRSAMGVAARSSQRSLQAPMSTIAPDAGDADADADMELQPAFANVPAADESV